MRKILFFAIVSLFFSSCKNQHNTEVVFKAEKDTVEIDSIYYVELYVSYVDSILPKFFIVKNLDTFRLFVNESKKCAIYKSVNTSPGLRSVNGFVEYINRKGKEIKKDYVIKYYVKPDSMSIDQLN